MQVFTTLTSVAAVLPEANVDTDIIYPARFLLVTQKKGLGQYAFFERRFEPSGEERHNFSLNQPNFRHAHILIVGANFGCGSSREQAVWALLDLGIRCLISTSFGEIFYSNCFKNSILPINVAQEEFALLCAAAQQGGILCVDLEKQSISCGREPVVAFYLPGWRREALMNGWDEIDMILEKEAENICAFEVQQQRAMPWLYEAPATPETPVSKQTNI